jgi:hypothetical protein
MDEPDPSIVISGDVQPAKYRPIQTIALSLPYLPGAAMRRSERKTDTNRYDPWRCE